MDNGRANRPERRTALIALEIQKLGLNIVALSKTHLPGAGQIEEPRHGHTFFWSGRAVEERRIHGVGFCVKSHLVRDHNIIPVRTFERLMSITLPLSQSQSLVIISAYAPTLDASEEAKESFYAVLRGLILRINPRDKLLVLGDFNARVGRDHQLWGGILGKEGVGNCNENGELLLCLCAETEMVITNTLFQMANKHKTTWQHPRSGHWHLIDYVLTRICDRADVMVTRAIRSMDDGWSDHRLVASRLRLKIAPAKRRKKIPK
ncbi:craniofacial development protein 2-like, partial [Hippocampus zosterae]|uniref:craniofacial development protein 2-like n=1 Tax=Hippocampus zosterae TaxID=109293 RepID=UPI00223CA817